MRAGLASEESRLERGLPEAVIPLEAARLEAASVPRGLPRAAAEAAGSATSDRVRLGGVETRVSIWSPAWVYAAVGVALTGVYFGFPKGSISQSVIYDGIAAAAGVAIVFGIARNRPDRRLSWYLFAAGQLAFATGDVIFDVYDRLGERPPVPSAADVFYLLGYPLIALGLLLLIAGLASRRRRAGLVEAGVVTCAFALAQWVFLMEPHLHEAGTTVAERAVALAYPALDVVLLAGLAAFFVTPAWRTPAYRLLVVGVVTLLIADEIYGLSVNSYSSGDAVDAGWIFSYTFWGAAALHPSMRLLGRQSRSAQQRIGPARIFFLALALLTAPGVLIAQWVRGRSLEPGAVAAAAGAISVLVVSRFAAIVQALERIRGRERAARQEAEAAHRLVADQNELLREADRLKDEFVAMVSHDLRTPLTSIIGFLDLTLDEKSGALNKDQRSYLEIAARNAERLRRLVDDLLFIARLQAGKLQIMPAELDLAELARQAVEEARPQAEARGVELALATEPTPTISGERNRLLQLVDNLISNALKFTPEGGRVEVSAYPVDDAIRLAVRDNGIGIPAGEVEWLFERFFRASNAVDQRIQGTGLGLHVARVIVEAHDGTISVESKVGSGTTFQVDLPAQVSAAVAPAAAAP
jgi:signal transduction histidine kinase